MTEYNMHTRGKGFEHLTYRGFDITRAGSTLIYYKVYKKGQLVMITKTEDNAAAWVDKAIRRERLEVFGG